MHITPIYDRVIIRRKDTLVESAGGLHIPENAQEKNLEGIVVAHGEGAVDKKTGKLETPISVKVGDHVVFPKHSGTDVEIEGEAYLIVVESEILAIVEP